MNNSLTVHPYPYLPAKIKIAARTLFNSHSITGLTMGQAHNLVAGYLEFNSNQALLSALRNDEIFLDPEDPETFYQFRNSIDCVRQMIKRFNNSQIGVDYALPICCAIEAFLFPECDCCHNNKHMTYPLLGVEEAARHLLLNKYPSQRWLCESCIRDRTPSEVDRCQLCDEDVYYLAEVIDHKGLCPEHRGEFDYSEEEREDLDSYIEYVGNHY